METNNYLAQILDRLNGWLSEKNLYFSHENVLFVRDDAVDYSAKQSRVQEQHLVTAGCFQQEFGAMLSGGPSWIHSNAVPLNDGKFLITLVSGQKIGSPKPSINVSYDPNNPIEIISTKIPTKVS